jgi:uncharacterized protein involved in exopolysaccharide biosynthesis
MTETDIQQNGSKYEEVSIKELVSSIKKLFDLKTKWIYVFLIGIFGAGIGLTYAYFQKPLYTASLTFALEDDKGTGGGLSGALGLASSLGIDLGTSAGGAFSGSNLIELMKSRMIVEQTLLDSIKSDGKDMSLAEMYIQTYGWRKGWINSTNIDEKKIQFYPNSDRKNFTIQQDSILGLLYESILEKNLMVAQKDKKVSIISIEVKTENQLLSKYFTEAIAKEVSDFYIETKSKKAKINVNILEKQADSIRTELNNAITGVATANDNTYNLNPSLNIKRTPSAKRQVDVQANTAILTELVRNLELAKVTLRKETPLIQIIDKPILPLKKDKVSKLKSLLLWGGVSGFFSIFFFMGQKWWKRYFI